MDFNNTIVVTGDIAIQTLQWKTFENTEGTYKWQSYPHIYNYVRLGEDFLLSKLISLSTNCTIISPKLTTVNEDPDDNALISTVQLELFPHTNRKNDKNKVFRIQEFLGFTGPASGKPRLFPIEDDDADASMVILDDENNGFHESEEYWPLAIKTEGKSPVILYKTNNLGENNKLLNHLEAKHLDRTIVVINADDLRSRGVNISKSISWERTALDFVWQMDNNPNIRSLARCRHLIILFGVEGAIHYQKEADPQSQLYFLTYEFEGDFMKDTLGKMYGLTSCFVAGLAQSISTGMFNHDTLEHAISDGIRTGITAAHKFFIHGFGEDARKSPYPNPQIFTESEGDFIYKEHVQDVSIRNNKNPNCQACWYIVKDVNSVNLAEISYDIVKNGEKSAMRYMPIAQFGNLKTVDRTEIEGYRSIMHLISEYLSVLNPPRPLSISVFGTPGSGKSFGVTEIAASIAPNLIQKLDFNLSQFHSTSDLTAAFHRVRDLSLEGKIPLVFFDEFDSFFEGKLGWLKYFLAPMQDGKFREGDAIHPIGKAIFVFAGGTSSTFDKFSGEEITDETERKDFMYEFQSAKGPDFISRLRGYVNILGPNQTDPEWDQLFIIRRAMLLRSLLERKVPYLINGNGEAQIDNGVLRALLKIPNYKHESRSMEAILEMSMLNGVKKWEQSHLPPKGQLKLHVDEEQFSRLLMQEEFFSEKIDKLSKDLLAREQHTYPSNCETGNANIRQQVKHIPIILQKVNYEVISVKERPQPIEFTTTELNILGEYEHKRYCLEKKEQGWIYGADYSPEEKTDPTLTSWNILPLEVKNSIISTIKTWPEILSNSNFKIERLKFLCRCEAQLIKS